MCRKATTTFTEKGWLLFPCDNLAVRGLRYATCSSQCFEAFQRLAFVDHADDVAVWCESKKNFSDPPDVEAIMRNLCAAADAAFST
jgi:hypothetical protein